MSRSPREPRFYKNQALMNELNDHFVMVKIWLFPEKITEASQTTLYKRHPRPSVEDLDELFSRVYAILARDFESIRKY